jgi:hypothetical protein
LVNFVHVIWALAVLSRRVTMRVSKRRDRTSKPTSFPHSVLSFENPLLGAYIGAVEILGLSGKDVLERDYLLSALLDMTPCVKARSAQDAQSELTSMVLERFRGGFPLPH